MEVIPLFCPTCGAALNGATLFCPSCDAPLQKRSLAAAEEAPARPVLPPATSVWHAIEIESMAYHRSNRISLYSQATVLLAITLYNIVAAAGLLPGNDLLRVMLTFIEFTMAVFLLAGWFVDTSARHLPVLWFQRKAWIKLLLYWLLMTALMNGPVYLVSRQIYPEIIALTAVACLVGVFFEVFPHRKEQELEKNIREYARERAAAMLNKPPKKPLRQRIMIFIKFIILYSCAYLTILPTLMLAEGGDIEKAVLLGPTTALVYILFTLWYREEGGDAMFESAIRDRSWGWHLRFWIVTWVFVSILMFMVAGISWQLFLAIGGSALALTMLFSVVARISVMRRGT